MLKSQEKHSGLGREVGIFEDFLGAGRVLEKWVSLQPWRYLEAKRNNAHWGVCATSAMCQGKKLPTPFGFYVPCVWSSIVSCKPSERWNSLVGMFRIMKTPMDDQSKFSNMSCVRTNWLEPSMKMARKPE